LKAKYQDDATAALVTLRADGQVGDSVSCSLQTSKALIEAGLHPATGGPGTQVCSGDMLLEALVACSGVTLAAVATALGINIGDAKIHAEGDLDFRGTLGVEKSAPVGFRAIRLSFDLGEHVSDEQRATLLKLTERYCVVLQTLKGGAELTTRARSA
ncbi:MAG: OsmC family protein, partial [Pseudomonadota bacterium]